MKLELKEIAKSLDLPKDTVERWVRQGKIPIQMKDGLCVFSRVTLNKWAQTHHFSLNLSETATPADDAVQENLSDDESLLSSMMRGGLLVDVPGSDSETVFRYVVGQIPGLSNEKKQELVERLLQREELVSTGIGKGIAVPHPRSPMPETISKPLVITSLLKNPIGFNAIDGQPVSVMFFLISPTTQSHLNLLSKLSFCLRDDAFITFLKAGAERNGLFERVKMIAQRTGSGSSR